MESKIKATPYTENTTEFKIRDLVQVKGFKYIYIVVASYDDAVDLLPLLNMKWEYTRGGIVKEIDVTELIHYNGCITIDQKV